MAAKDQGGFVASRHRDGAFASDDDALVAHLRCEQGDIAAKGCLQRAKVQDTARLAVTLESVFAGHEVGVADAVGGDKQTTDIHLRGGTEEYAVGVDDEDLAWGVDAPHDLAGVVVKNAVKGDGGGVGLVEIDLCARADVEGIPVDGGALAALLHRQGVARTADGRTPTHHLAALGQLRGRRWALGEHNALAQQSRGQGQGVQIARAGFGHGLKLLYD